MTAASITVWTAGWRDRGGRECVESLKWNSLHFTPLSGKTAQSHYALQSFLMRNYFLN